MRIAWWCSAGTPIDLRHGHAVDNLGSQRVLLPHDDRPSHRQPAPHQIWFVVDGESVWLLTERAAETHWVKNLRVNPTVTLEVGELTMEADAEVVANLPADAPLRARLASRYSPSPDGDNLESWAAGALAVRITPH
jgi:hypothetical protein